jgi:lipopolysaccharide export system permease protein
MNILSRYLSREVAMATMVVLLALTLLFAFFDLIHELSDLGKGNYRVAGALLYVALSIPSRAYEIFPVAALIGALYALSQLASHSELTVMRVSGLSLAQVARAMLPVGLALLATMLLIGEAVAPGAEKYAAYRVTRRAGVSVRSVDQG